LSENALHSLVHVWQSSIASSNSRTAYIHTFMYAEPFLTASTRASSPSDVNAFGPWRPLLKLKSVPASAAETHLSA
jgi:hypothetical protein